MALPTIISISEDALHAVPGDLRQGSLALGNTRWQTTYKVVVPAASSGIFAAVMLGLGRAIGETMVVLMLAGNSGLIPTSPLQAGPHADRHDRRRRWARSSRAAALLGAVRDGARAVRDHVRRSTWPPTSCSSGSGGGGADEPASRRLRAGQARARGRGRSRRS